MEKWLLLTPITVTKNVLIKVPTVKIILLTDTDPHKIPDKKSSHNLHP